MARLICLCLLLACVLAPPSTGFRHSAALGCCTDVHIRVCLPAWEIDPILGFDAADGSYGGYIVDMLDVLSSELGFTYVAVPHERALVNGTLPAGCDVAALYVTWHSVLPEVRRTTAATVPIYESQYNVLVATTETSSRFFRILDPFATDLWLCIIAFPLFTALAVALLEAIAPPPGERRDEGKPKLRCSRAVAARSATISYHMVAALLGGEDFEWATWPKRVLRMGLLFVALIVSSTYTANLVAFFNMPAVRIHGPDSLDTLRDSRACVTNPDAEELVAPFVREVVKLAPAEGASRHGAPGAKSFCHEQLRKGGATAWIEDEHIATQYLRGGHCSDLHLRANLAFIPERVTLFAGIEDESLIANMSIAILNFMSQPDYPRLLTRCFATGMSPPCTTSHLATSTTPVRMDDLYGMFVIYGLAAGLALAIAVAQCTARAKRAASPDVVEI